MEQMKAERNQIILLVLAVLFVVLGSRGLIEESRHNKISSDILIHPEFRRQSLCDNFITYLEKSEFPAKAAGLYMLETDFGTEQFQGSYTTEEFKKIEEEWGTASFWNSYLDLCESIWKDLRYFPVADIIGDTQAGVSYSDSWMYERNYGGTSGHEGCDIMADKNIRGFYPVVSMTDGVVINKGWLEKGGYRIGIQAPEGGYFYYAHLASYADINQGDSVKAGDLLGFMGDSGYSKEEGTVGKFAVHLHLGIYLYQKEKEISVNPYWILRYLDHRKIKCSSS